MKAILDWRAALVRLLRIHVRRDWQTGAVDTVGVFRGVLKVSVSRYKWLRLVLCSGDGEGHRGCRLNIGIAGLWIDIALPQWLLRPRAEKQKAGWDEATVERLGRDWYYVYTDREYGFSFGWTEGVGGSRLPDSLTLMYGLQADDSSIDQRKHLNLNWARWRFHRVSLYDRGGRHVWTQMEEDEQRARKAGGGKWTPLDGRRFAERMVPKVRFNLLDYDGTPILATTHIEEREWRRGAGWFRWLSWFYKPLVRRSLSISMDHEVGTEKGSWKGGLMGTGTDMEPGELHEAAMQRWCARTEYRRPPMTYVGIAMKSALEEVLEADEYEPILVLRGDNPYAPELAKQYAGALMFHAKGREAEAGDVWELSKRMEKWCEGHGVQVLWQKPAEPEPASEIVQRQVVLAKPQA